MGYNLEVNTILSVPDGQIDLQHLTVGTQYKVVKSGERLFVLNIPIDMCDENYVFVAKVAVRKLTLSRNETQLEIEVMKLFTNEESKIISDNFSKEA